MLGFSHISLHVARRASRSFLAILHLEGYRSGHNEAVLKTAKANPFWVRISCSTVLTIQRKFDIIFTAEDNGYTFLQMRSMYCFVEYKMLLFNPTLQETIGDDIIYVISKPPEDSAYGSYRSTTESNRRLLLCLCTDTGMVYFGRPFFLSMKNKKRSC